MHIALEKCLSVHLVAWNLYTGLQVGHNNKKPFWLERAADVKFFSTHWLSTMIDTQRIRSYLAKVYESIFLCKGESLSIWRQGVVGVDSHAGFPISNGRHSFLQRMLSMHSFTYKCSSDFQNIKAIMTLSFWSLLSNCWGWPI